MSFRSYTPTRTDIEARAIRAIRAAEAGQPVEDAGTELKHADILSDLPKMAERMAGHWNASAPEPCLWIVGVDEKGRKATGLPEGFDIADWRNRLEAEFDAGHVAEITEVIVPYDDELRVLALYMEPVLPPYVVLNRSKGPDRWVPWRHGTRIRAARHVDLVSLSSPRVRLPDWESMSASLKVGSRTPTQTRMDVRWRIYSSPAGSTGTAIPQHRCLLKLSTEARVIEVPSAQVHLRPAHGAAIGTLGAMEGPTLTWTGDTLIAKGPGMIEVYAYFDHPRNPFQGQSRVEIELEAGVLDSDLKLVLREALHAGVGPDKAEWTSDRIG